MTSSVAVNGEDSCEVVTVQYSTRGGTAWFSRCSRPSPSGISYAECHHLAEVRVSYPCLTAQEGSARCHRMPCGGSEDNTIIPEGRGAAFPPPPERGGIHAATYMHGEELRRVLEQVTEEILDRMRRKGFYYEGELRYDPIVWDVSNGHCEPWAKRAAELIPGAFTAWIDPDVDHCVLVYGGRFYDADCLEGAERWTHLPMFADPQHERPEP